MNKGIIIRGAQFRSRIFTLLLISTFVMFACKNATTSIDENEQIIPDAGMLAKMNPETIMDPNNVIPDLGNVNIEKFFVEHNVTIKSKESTTGYEIIELGTLNTNSISGFSYGFAINNNTQATGQAYYGSGYHAFRWESGSMTDLGALNSSNYDESYGRAINNKGEVTGYSYYGNNYYYHAFIWDETNGMTEIGGLPNSNYSYGTDIRS